MPPASKIDGSNVGSSIGADIAAGFFISFALFLAYAAFAAPPSTTLIGIVFGFFFLLIGAWLSVGHALMAIGASVICVALVTVCTKLGLRILRVVCLTGYFISLLWIGAYGALTMAI